MSPISETVTFYDFLQFTSAGFDLQVAAYTVNENKSGRLILKALNGTNRFEVCVWLSASSTENFRTSGLAKLAL